MRDKEDCMKLKMHFVAVIFGALFVIAAGGFCDGDAWDCPSHEGPVVGIRCFNDGKRFLSVGTGGTIQICGVKQGRLLKKFKTNSGTITTMALSPDEKYVAVGCADNAVRLVSVETGSCRHTLSPPSREKNASVTAVSFSPDGKWAASGHSSGRVHLWDVKKGAHDKEFSPEIYPPDKKAHMSGIAAVAFTPDSNYVLTTEEKKSRFQMSAWNRESGRFIRPFSVYGGIYSMQFIPGTWELIVWRRWGGIGIQKWFLSKKIVNPDKSGGLSFFGQDVKQSTIGYGKSASDLPSGYGILAVDGTGKYVAWAEKKDVSLCAVADADDPFDPPASFFPRAWGFRRTVTSIAISPGGRCVIIGQEDGTIARNLWLDTQDSDVLTGLDWLMRHQMPDGSWSSGKKDMVTTALAILAFTGFGFTHEGGRYAAGIESMGKACPFLKCRLGESGEKTPLLDHAIATTALAELLLLSGDAAGLKDQVEQAAAFCIRTQKDDGGWGGLPDDGESTTFTTGWMVCALKTVKVCKDLELVSVPADAELKKAFQGALNWFDRVTDKKTGLVCNTVAHSGKSADSQGKPSGDFFVDGVPVMTAVSVLSRLLAGQSRSSDVIKKGIEQITAYAPWKRDEKTTKHLPINHMYTYFGSFAVFQIGDEPWQRWYPAMLETLYSRQVRKKRERSAGSATGSWNPQGFWSKKYGRVAATALGILSIEVYYRYQRAKGGSGD